MLDVDGLTTEFGEAAPLAVNPALASAQILLQMLQWKAWNCWRGDDTNHSTALTSVCGRAGYCVATARIGTHDHGASGLY